MADDGRAARGPWNWRLRCVWSWGRGQVKATELLEASKAQDEKWIPITKLGCLARAGQRTWFKAFVAIRDYDQHVGLDVKCSKEVATAIRGANILVKLSIARAAGLLGEQDRQAHTVPGKVTAAVALC
ncbi:hypothetical protein mRhiFer1_009145 [Rhinolophus ferrumequinum]|uniref:S5 DRBM domain-containing protein n=1 Tax=Rhinolophus ferrumequinum TaxID=59479 RepID=A0A7J7SIZ3_RHIFE|nr:hypothetical protein mRhiFer1_009145 [Rhinolophus ferrumequinum]